MKKQTVRLFTFLLAIAFVFSLAVVPASAIGEDEVQASQTPEELPAIQSIADYIAYTEDNSSVKPATSDIVLNGADYTSEEGSGVVKASEYEGEKDVIVWESQKGKVTYTFNVPEEALYNIRFTYKALGSSERDLDIGIMIDGQFAFDGLEKVELPLMWRNSDNIRTDDYGNQFSPEQVLYGKFYTKALYDLSGASVYPYEFKFTAGAHTVTVITNSEKWVISKIALSVPESAIKSYSELKAEYDKKGYKSAEGEAIVIEGENADIKSTRSLIPMSDNASPVLTPSSATKSVVNYIGNTNWQLPNEELVWNFDVASDGYYNLGFMFKQDQVINGFSYRKLQIDGKTPFKEASNIKFLYSTKWQNTVFSDSDDVPYLFYLTKGSHTISLTGTLGEMAPSYYDLETISSNLGTLYLDIVMITGESPDANRDYDLFKTIPDFMDRLEQYSTDLDNLAKTMQELSGEKGSSLIATLNNMKRVLNSMLENKYSAQTYVTDYYSQYTTLSSWLYDMQKMPLNIDQIRLTPSDSETVFKDVGFFEDLKFGFDRFFISFSESYSRISYVKGDANAKSIKIWVNWGRDQAQVLNSLIQESFTPYAEKELGYKVNVNLELVNADIIKGMLSHNAPDLSLQLARSQPVNLALRGALVDLTQFDDYEETVKEFAPTASIPYEYNGGVYALPDTQGFYLMFYRTDIFEKLNLKIPQTWDEFLAVTAVLQRNNMNSYLPYTKISSAGVVNTGVGGLNLFCSVLMQMGGNIYNDTRTECLLDTPMSLSAFTYWTDMYTKYKIPTEASFYNRFRVGTMPLGIMGYTQYTMFLEAAPEIANRWGIAMVPGVKKEDGTIDRTISGSGTGCSVLSTSENPLEAWTFLKWWTSESTQTRYNTNVESILGSVARVSTSNIKAFSNMAWQRGDLEILLDEFNSIIEVPEVPGSYYVSRSVDQAYWNVINAEKSPKDALTRWGKEANNEITRKIAEYAD